MPYFAGEFSPSILSLPGDSFPVDHKAGKVYHVRGGAVIGSRDLSEEPTNLGNTPPNEGSFTTNRILYFVESLMAVSLSVTDVQFLENGDRQIFYSNGSDETLNATALAARAAEASETDALKRDIAAYWQARSSDFSSSTSIVGKTFQKDMSLELGQFQVGEV